MWAGNRHFHNSAIWARRNETTRHFGHATLSVFNNTATNNNIKTCLSLLLNKCDAIPYVAIYIFTKGRVKCSTSKLRDNRLLLQLSVTRHRKQTKEQKTKRLINSKNTMDKMKKKQTLSLRFVDFISCK